MKSRNQNSIQMYENIPYLENEFPILIKKYYNSVFHTHWHEHIEIHHIISGKLTVSCNGKFYELKEGDTLFINSDELHSCIPDENFTTLCLIISSSLISQLNLENILFPNEIKADKTIESLFNEIYREACEKKTLSNVMILSHVCHLLTYLSRKYICNSSTLHKIAQQTYNHEKINKILDYIHTNYKENITTRSLAGHFFMSESHICHIFKNYTNSTIVEYLTDYRLYKSIELLLNPKITIKLIATNVGFTDENYFSRLFKRKYHITPSQFRKDKASVLSYAETGAI